MKRIAFSGWPAAVPAADRLKKIDEFLAKFAPGFRTVAVDNLYRGPCADRKLTTAAYAEFPSSDAQREALNSVSG